MVTTTSLSTAFNDEVAAIEALAGTSSTDVSTIARLLQAQTDAMAAQAKGSFCPESPAFTPIHW